MSRLEKKRNKGKGERGRDGERREGKRKMKRNECKSMNGRVRREREKTQGVSKKGK